MDDRFTRARQAFIDSCQMDDSAIRAAMERGRQDGLICLHINTQGDNNIAAADPGLPTLYKHKFLQQPYVRNEIVQYYKQKGYSWVDVIPLNRVQWKIFLFYSDPQIHTPIRRQDEYQGDVV